MAEDVTADVRDRVVVITGVTGTGLGSALANLLAARGARVVGAGRRASEGEAWARSACAAGGDSFFLKCDVSSVEDCRRLIDTAVACYGRVDILINNAGVVGSPPFLESTLVTEELWDQIVDVNLKGAFFCARFAIGQMLMQNDGGHVINIASRRATMVSPRMIPYAASKAAMVHMGCSLAEEFRDAGIRVNNVLLGGVSSENTTSMMTAMRNTDPAVAEQLGHSLPGGLEQAARSRLASAADVAEGVAALLGPAFRLMTGATVAVTL